MKYRSLVKLSALRESEVGSLAGKKFLVMDYCNGKTTVVFDVGAEKKTFILAKDNPKVVYLGRKRSH